MMPARGAADQLTLAGTAIQRAQTKIISQPVFLCYGCGRPTSRGQGICRLCLAWHLRLDGLLRANAVRDEVAP